MSYWTSWALITGCTHGLQVRVSSERLEGRRLKKTTGSTGQGCEMVVKTEQGPEFQGKQVILATGAAMSLAEALNLEFTDGREARYPRVVKVDIDGRTSMPGIWAAGIIAGVSAHTIVTAGHGAHVAIGLISELEGKRHVQHDVLNK